MTSDGIRRDDRLSEAQVLVGQLSRENAALREVLRTMLRRLTPSDQERRHGEMIFADADLLFGQELLCQARIMSKIRR